MRLIDRVLENHRPFVLPSRRNDANLSLECIEFGVFEDLVGEESERGAATGPGAATHYLRHVGIIYFLHFGHGIASSKKCGDDRPRACSENKIKAAVKWLFHHCLDFFEDSNGVEALCSTAIKRQNPERFIGHRTSISSVAPFRSPSKENRLPTLSPLRQGS